MSDNFLNFAIFGNHCVVEASAVDIIFRFDEVSHHEVAAESFKHGAVLTKKLVVVLQVPEIFDPFLYCPLALGQHPLF